MAMKKLLLPQQSALFMWTILSMLYNSCDNKAYAFSSSGGYYNHHQQHRKSSSSSSSSSFVVLGSVSQQGETTTTEVVSFIDTELRGAAMRLHTREQAPKEGKAESKPEPKGGFPPVTLQAYLSFLVDSQHVYKALESIVNEKETLSIFRNTGMERVQPLEKDIEYLTTKYSLQRPEVGEPGLTYAKHLHDIHSIPEFMCHFYNFYFAHTAGGRMIGKQLSNMLLNKHTLEFYKWEGGLGGIKSTLKGNIDARAAEWNEVERKECVDATAACFNYAGALNKILVSGGDSSSN